MRECCRVDDVAVNRHREIEHGGRMLGGGPGVSRSGERSVVAVELFELLGRRLAEKPEVASPTKCGDPSGSRLSDCLTAAVSLGVK